MRGRAAIAALVALVVIVSAGLVPTDSVFVGSERNTVNRVTVAQNVARGKVATQSSNYDPSPGPPQNAVDGNTDGNYNNRSVTHTADGENQSWWQVDLGAVVRVGTIRLWNRTDCCGERNSDYWVFVSSTPFTNPMAPTARAAIAGVWSVHLTTQMGSPTTVQPAQVGRYLMVQLSGTSNGLSLAEVEVFNNTG